VAAYFGVKLNLPYKKYPAASTLGGFFYVASLSVNIALPLANSRPSKRFDAVIDSGASGCLFHASIGRAIGLQIEKGVLASTLGVAGPSKMYLHDVSLYIPGGIVIAEPDFQTISPSPDCWV
jgi:hypothetical protein